MLKKDKALGCGCLIVLLMATILGSFLFGTYYGRTIIDAVKIRIERIYNRVSDSMSGVGDDLKDVVDDVKEGVKDVGDDDSYIID